MLKNGSFINRKYRVMLIGSLLGWLVALLGGMADSLVAGIFLDAEAVSAVGLISPIYSMVYFVSLLFTYGAAIMYSTELGAFHIEKSQKIAGMSVLCAVVLGLLMALLLYVGKPLVFAYYDCSERIMALASQYYNYFIFIALFFPLHWGLYYLVCFDGDEACILTVDIVMAIVNAVVSALLVQRLGIGGLAVGTLLSDVVGILLLIPHFFKKSNSIRFKLHFSFRDMLEMLKLSSAYSSATLYVALIGIIMNKVIILLYSDAFLPAYTVVNAVLNFAAAMSCAINGAATLLAVAYGEGNPNAIRRLMKRVHYAAFAIAAALGLLLIVLAPLWPTLYAITQAPVASAAVFAGRLIPCAFLVSAIVYTYIGYYPLVGKSFAGNILSLFYMLIGPLILAIPLGKAYAFSGLATGFFLTPFFTLLCLFLYLLFTRQLKSAPLLLKPTDEAEAHFDMTLEMDSIYALQSGAASFLKEQGVESRLVNEVSMIMEDALVHIRKKNRKPVLCECTLLVNDAHVRMITKDNGVIFDLLEDADSSRDFRCYVMARIMEQTEEKSNTTTITFNRNTFLWPRAEAEG